MSYTSVTSKKRYLHTSRYLKKDARRFIYGKLFGFINPDFNGVIPIKNEVTKQVNAALERAGLKVHKTEKLKPHKGRWDDPNGMPWKNPARQHTKKVDWNDVRKVLLDLWNIADFPEYRARTLIEHFNNAVAEQGVEPLKLEDFNNG